MEIGVGVAILLVVLLVLVVLLAAIIIYKRSLIDKEFTPSKSCGTFSRGIAVTSE